MNNRVMRIIIAVATVVLVSTFVHSAYAAHRHHHHYHGGPIGGTTFAPRVYAYPNVRSYGFVGPGYGGYVAPHHHHHHHHHGW